jgi:iron complex transport system ATP-binding protein
MQLTRTTELKDRDFRTLSGGEKQQIVLASALAQMPSALLLDEPAAFLDVEHQIALYRLLQTLSNSGVLVLAITHDLNLAATYSGRVVLLQHGELVADGPPATVLNTSTLKDVFRVDAHVQAGPGGRPWIQYGA